MANMSYCRFENTAPDLRDCEEHWDDLDEDSTSHELVGRRAILRLCIKIVADYGDTLDEMDEMITAARKRGA